MAKKTLAIVGSHVRTRQFAPWSRKYINIWVFNEAVSLTEQGQKWVQRCDAVFQMHKPAIWKNPKNRNDPHHFDWLQKEHPFPIYMLDDYEEVPSCVKYPLEEVCTKLIPNLYRGKGKDQENLKYFTSGPAYAIALAGYLDYEAVELYGIEMETNTEYTYQRDAIFFWIGILVGRGIEVTIHPLTNLFRAPLYGYEGDAFINADEFAFRLKNHLPIQTQMRERLDNANRMQMNALEGAKQNGKEDKFIKQYTQSVKLQRDAMLALGEVDGAIEECKYFIEKANVMDEAAGEHLFSRQEFEQRTALAQDHSGAWKSKLDQMGLAAQQAWRTLQDAKAKKYNQRKIERLAEKYGEAHKEYLKTAYQFGRVMGALNENGYYLHRADELIKAAGGAKSEEALIEARKRELDAATV